MVHVEGWRQAYTDILSRDFLNSLSYERAEEIWRRTLSSPGEITLVAEIPETGIVGFVSAGAERSEDPLYTGEVYAIYLLKSHWRQGIGKRLFKEAARALRQDGHIALLVWVLKDNPACRFYEALGGIYLRAQEIQIGEQRLLEVAYGWKDTLPLISGE